MANYLRPLTISITSIIILLVFSIIGTAQSGKVNFTCATKAYPPEKSRKIEEFIVNLDTPPEQRWNSVLEKHTGNVRNLLAVFRSFVDGFGYYGPKVFDLIDKYVPHLLNGLPQEYVREMHGISNYTKIPLGEVVMFNVFYEFFTVCTSIIARDAQGELYHARNMDFGLLLGWNDTAHTWSVSHALRPMIVNLVFQKANKTVYKAVSFAGFIGVLTAVKPQNFTFTINERFALKGGFLGLIHWILGEHNQQWLSVFTRQVMEKAQDFDTAKQLLSTTPLLAPAYFILGGTKRNEGCVISRSREGAIHTRCLNESNWFVLETNYDWWKKPLFLDDRRTPAVRCMNALTTKNVNMSSLFNILATRPMLNKLTIYTALMRASDGHLESWRDDCQDPCTPW